MGVSGSGAPRRGEGWRLWVRLVLAGGVLVGAWWLAEGLLGGSSAQAHDCVDRYGSGAFSYGEAEGANSGHGHFCGVRSTTPTTPTTAPPSNGGVSDPESLTPIDRSGQHSAPHSYWHANHADRSHCDDGDHYYHDRYTRARSCGGASSGSDACVSGSHRHTYSGSWCHPDHTAANGDCRTHRDDGTHEANPCPDDSADDDDDGDACVSGSHRHTYSGSWCHLDHTAANGDCRTHRDDGTHEANPCPDDDADDDGGGGCSVALGALGAGTVTRSGTWAAGCTSDNRGSAQVPYRAVRYTFSVAGAATATVGVSSSTDAYVYLTNADRSLSRHDNNSGAHSGDALLSAVSLAAASYTVEATTAAPRQDGAFTMTLTIADAPDPPPDVVISGLADASATPAAGAATAAASDTFGVTPAGAACSATPHGATVAPAAGASRTVTHTVAAGTTVTVTVTCTTSTSTATADARFTADAAPVPDVEIDGLDHASATPATDTTSAEVTETFTVTPAAARCSAQATPGTPQVAPATGTSRTVTLDVAAGTTVWVIVICNHHTNRDLAATRFTAHPTPTNTDTTTPPPTATPTPPTTTTPTANSDDCDTPLGALTAATPPTTGTLAATDGCTSTRHPRKTATSTYQARRHTFTLNSPGWVTITLESAATNTQRIDTYLVLLRGHTPDGTGTYITHNDDAQNAASHGLHWRDSRLVDVFLQPGHYTIEATTYHAHSTTNPTRTTGDYDLTVEATLTGLQASYDAYAGQQLTIGFETGDFTPTATVPVSGLAASATKSGTTASLTVTPSRTGAFSVTLSFSRPSGSSARSTRSATARAAAAASTVVPVNSTCPAGQKPNPNPPAGTCVLKSDAELFAERGAKGRYYVTPALVAGTKKVAEQSLDAYVGECGMRPGRLAAAMMAIGFWETPVTATASDTLYNVRNVKRDPARSLMTLSRGDFHQFRAKGKNAVLYPDNLQIGDTDAGLPVRAFWHPGVGYWQLDLWETTKHMNHAERADIEQGGRKVADVLRDAYCDNGGASGLKAKLKNEWEACVEVMTEAGEKSNVCYETAATLYLGFVTGTGGEAFYVTTTHNLGDDSVTGGAPLMEDGCRWGSTGTPFDCWFYDTDSYQGHAETGRANGDRNLATAISPYAAPFMSFTHENKKYAVFPESFTGGTITRMKFVSTAKLVRAEPDNTWSSDEDPNAVVLQVKICPRPPASRVCAWTGAADPNFKSRIRAVYPDANPSRDP
ncbi:hypothetical protein [Candidatus Poriferisodalis sp.]|uniref:hypothetical protein n=1 Tax=Candidatus Poriferisodalis sp. TaxID=3101277 RepID=UPI003AF984EA